MQRDALNQGVSPQPKTGAPLSSEDVGLVRDYWSALCDSDWHLIPEGVRDGLEDRLVSVGLAEWRSVTDDDLSDSFAADRGLEKGGSCLDLTALGYLAYKADADGWIPAPEGGWGENPVPGMVVVEVRFSSGIVSELLDSECFGWDRHKDPVIAPFYDIIAFRLPKADGIDAPAPTPPTTDPRLESESVKLEDVLFFKLKDLILEQSEGEWTDAMIVRDAHHFANHLRPLFRLSNHISGVREKVEDEAGPAEKEVGRAVYERIEKLLDTDENGAERAYLSHLVESVEEVGGYDGPSHPAPTNEVAAAVEGGDDLPVWHREDGDLSTLLYTLRQTGWRSGQPVMVNDVMVTIQAMNGSETPVEPVIQAILTALRAQPNGGAK